MKHEIAWGLRPMMFAACAVLYCDAVLASETEPAQESTLVANVSVGYQRWTALSDLDTEEFGSFEEEGFNVSVSGHGRWKRWGHSTLLLGADLGLMSHDSNIRAPGDIGKLSADVLFLTPSIRLAFGKPRSLHLNLEAGLGLYWADIKEFVGTSYGVVEGRQHFDEIAPGAYVGASIDIPIGKKRRWHVNLGGRVHYADFGTVNALGVNMGRLDGPITSAQLGFSYYR